MGPKRKNQAKSSTPTTSSSSAGPSTTKKRKPLPSDELPDCEHLTSGLRNTLHGNIYQLKILLLFIKRASERNYNFKLATELTQAEKFDDVVLQYRKPGT